MPNSKKRLNGSGRMDDVMPKKAAAHRLDLTIREFHKFMKMGVISDGIPGYVYNVNYKVWMVTEIEKIAPRVERMRSLLSPRDGAGNVASPHEGTDTERS